MTGQVHAATPAANQVSVAVCAGHFTAGALLTLIVSSVSLYSWHEQSSQIR